MSDKPLQHRHLTTHDDQPHHGPHGHFHHHGDDHTVMLADDDVVMSGAEAARLQAIETAARTYLAAVGFPDSLAGQDESDAYALLMGLLEQRAQASR